MDSSSSQTVAAHAMNDRIPLPADTNVVPPRYRPIIIREWASRFPTYYAEFEELHWTFDGWDALADELHADWLYYITAATRVRAKIDELWKGKTTFASSAERTRYKKWLYEESDRLYEEGGRLEERLQGPGGLGLLRRRFLKLHQELDRGSRLSGLPSLSGKSLLASAVAAAKTLASKIAIPSDELANTAVPLLADAAEPQAERAAPEDRISLPADTNVIPPRYRPIISREWAVDYPTYYAEFEELYWIVNGWDALTDELYADWLLYMAEAKRVRAEIEEMWKGRKTFAEAARQAAHETWLYRENKRLYDSGGKLKERLEGPGGLCLLRRRFLKLYPDLDRESYLSGLPSLSDKSLLSAAFRSVTSLASQALVSAYEAVFRRPLERDAES
ncbi:hypothetical protein OF846_002191 [Rhodotorula toruloides]|nr:hypothetical protein OF846_002191 [Rhodotorula toruloides]